jgi:hypothetical protein
LLTNGTLITEKTIDVFGEGKRRMRLVASAQPNAAARV